MTETIPLFARRDSRLVTMGKEYLLHEFWVTRTVSSPAIVSKLRPSPPLLSILASIASTYEATPKPAGPEGNVCSPSF